MVDTQHFCLRWNNYQSSITSAFENLRDDEDFVDVTLACDGRSLKAHRVVLSACSPYFRELLKSTPCKHPVIVLQDVAFTDLHALVEFIYHGEVNVHQRSLSSFLKTAEVLRVSGLTQQQAEETHNLAQVQSLAQNGGRTPLNHHQSYTDKLVEEALFPQGASPPPHLNNLHNPSAHSGATVNQLLRRAAAAAFTRRERNNSCHSDELQMKRHRPDSGMMGPNINNNNLDIINHMPQITATDFSTNIKHINNNHSPHIKDTDRMDVKTPNGNNNNTLSTNNNVVNSNINNNNNNNNNMKDTINLTTNGNGGGSLGSSTDKESLTPSPPARSQDDVKTEPLELVSNSINPDNDHSNDSVVDLHSNTGNEMKGPLSSPHDDDMDGSIHNHNPPPFLMSPGDKLFPPPGSFNFSMAALAADPQALANFNSMQSAAAELAGSPQGIGNHGSGNGDAGGILSNRLSLPLPLTACHRCDVCGKLLSTKLTLKRHKEQQHLQPLNNAVCNLCHKVFRTLNSLNNHKSIYHRRQKHHLYSVLFTFYLVALNMDPKKKKAQPHFTANNYFTKDAFKIT
ncbi:CLUMA_CG004736, isoform A [Clunio marinus]|uniref:CLUMA_CG004736, isoform A n=1 Tax=Clunio marinus TaxID=568069 RepID=A0A1J1HSJ5_9DIPT|nr:CLUMA_CG004736, isoform A [Clunio marinus]